MIGSLDRRMGHALMFMRGRALAACLGLWTAALALCGFTQTAQALTQHPPYPYGAPGDAGAVDGCEAGWYIVGFRIRSGLWFDSIGVICARRVATGYVDDKVVAIRGGPGGGAATNYRCHANEVVTFINVWADDPARRVNHMRASCNGGPSFQGRLIEVGGTPADSKHVQNQPCGAGEAGFALEIRYGKDVNAIGLRCRPLEAPMAQQIPDPSVDKRSDDPPLADTQAFTGVWKVNASSGSTFYLTLNVAGDAVSGNFQVAGQPRYDATLSGKAIAKGVIRFTWTQPQVPDGGEGSLEVFTNNTFRGFLNEGKPGLPLIKWTGVKQTIHHTGKPRPADGPADGGNGPKATAVQGTTVYKTHSGSSSASNKVCGMRPGDAGTVVSKGPDQWVDLANISGLSCAGQSGWVWNGGTLKLP
jgi:hypothetical protein